MTAHIVMPARRSNVPDCWVRVCANPSCPWQAHDPDPTRLAVLARHHHEHPDEPTEPEQLRLDDGSQP